MAYADDHNNRGIELLEQGEIEAAAGAFEQARSLEPDHGPATWNLATTRLLQGRHAEGWALHELRPSVVERGEVIDLDGRPTPRWKGEPLEGRRLVVIAEQGLGDQIQFLRFVPELVKRGARVSLGLAPQLARLARGIPGVESVLTRAGESDGRFHHWIQLMSLPHYLGATLEHLPGEVPYLRAPADTVRGWRRELAQGLKVGVIWAGDRQHPNDANRSLPLERLETLLESTDVTFVSLQKGEPEPRLPARWISLGDHLTDMADTAAVMENLDLVISVDTSTAHLAGALGRPAWTLLPWVPDWRWMLERTDTPWYPTMRLFRQPRKGDWDTVVTTLRAELESWIRTQSSPGAVN